jgi:hypothetical protein
MSDLEQTKKELALSEQIELPPKGSLQTNGLRGTANPRKIDIELLEACRADDPIVKQRFDPIEMRASAGLAASLAAPNTGWNRGRGSIKLELCPAAPGQRLREEGGLISAWPRGEILQVVRVRGRPVTGTSHWRRFHAVDLGLTLASRRRATSYLGRNAKHSCRGAARSVPRGV